jgi:hypothetical protein
VAEVSLKMEVCHLTGWWEWPTACHYGSVCIRCKPSGLHSSTRQCSSATCADHLYYRPLVRMLSVHCVAVMFHLMHQVAMPG